MASSKFLQLTEKRTKGEKNPLVATDKTVMEGQTPKAGSWDTARMTSSFF